MLVSQLVPAVLELLFEELLLRVCVFVCVCIFCCLQIQVADLEGA